MTHQPAVPPLISGRDLHHAESRADLGACYPIIRQLRPYLVDSDAWVARVREMKEASYRVLAVWNGRRALALAGYRKMDNLIYGRFLYVDDLVTDAAQRGNGYGAALLAELSRIGSDLNCDSLVLDTAATNLEAQRFYAREGMMDAAKGYVKQLRTSA